MAGNEKKIRLTLVGAEGSGKTELRKKIINQEQFSVPYRASKELDFSAKTVIRNQTKVVFNIWDMPGNQHEKSDYQLGLKGSAIIVLCVDPTSPNAIENLQKYKIECDEWIATQRNLPSFTEPTFIVVSTKSDCNSPENWENDVASFMQNNGIDPQNRIQVSAKENRNVAALVSGLVSLVDGNTFVSGVTSDPNFNSGVEEVDVSISSELNDKVSNNKNCLSPVVVFNGLAILAGLVVGSLVAAAVSFMTANPLAAIVAGLGAGAATTGGLVALGFGLFGGKRQEKSSDTSTELDLSIGVPFNFQSNT